MKPNLFALSSLPEYGEMTEELLSYRNITINRIVSSDILEVDTFCQKEAEWVVLLAGNAQIKIMEHVIIYTREILCSFPR